jgi:hypothetical protein
MASKYSKLLFSLSLPTKISHIIVKNEGISEIFLSIFRFPDAAALRFIKIEKKVIKIPAII